MTRQKFISSMLGLAIGDALGYPVEFMKSHEIVKRFGSKGLSDLVDGRYSDDTQMTIAIAKALIDSGKKDDVESVMKNVKKRFVEWLHDPENNRAPGKTCLFGCNNLEEGMNWKLSGDRWSKGCGAAMRTAPIGLFYDNEDKIAEIAYASSICTHAHDTGVASGMATAYLTHLALKGVDPKEYVNRLVSFTERQGKRFKINVSEFNNKIREIDKIKDLVPGHAIPRLGEGWTGEEAVAIGLYCFLQSPKDYANSVLLAANTNGDSDSNACICGAISGAYNGISKIPERWVKRVENTGMLRELAEDLYKAKRS